MTIRVLLHLLYDLYNRLSHIISFVIIARLVLNMAPIIIKTQINQRIDITRNTLPSDTQYNQSENNYTTAKIVKTAAVSSSTAPQTVTSL